LAQTYQIMQWHYGSVDFDSTVGAGTTFHLRPPAAAAKADGNREPDRDEEREMTA